MSSVTEKWERTRRIPCSRCGGPTGWKAWQKVASPTCNRCRSDYTVFEHGTGRGYQKARCRCDECRGWKRRQVAAYAARRRAEGRPVKRFGSSGPWISERVRMAVFVRDAWMCQICGDPLDRDADPNANAYPSIDHIVPQSKGGGHEISNLRAAHRWCNSIRQDRDG